MIAVSPFFINFVKKKSAMQTTPKASIIILAYNHEKTISAALDSILSQQRDFPIEVIIGDDASTDGTRAICQRYADLHPEEIRLMPEAPNKGLVGNYFDCLASAKGEYVADCAGDDIWGDSDRLMRQVRALDSDRSLVAVTSSWDIDDGSHVVNSSTIKELDFCHRPCSGRDMITRTLSLQNEFPLLSAMLFRRRPIADILRDNPSRLRNDDWHNEDIPIIAALSDSGDFGYVPVTASVYYINPDGVAHNANPGRLCDFFIGAANCILDLCSVYGLSPKSFSSVMKARLHTIFNLVLDSGDIYRFRNALILLDRMPEMLTMGIRLRIAIMSNPILWKSAMTVKKLKRRLRHKA